MQWRNIPGYPGYRVNDKGGVQTFWKQRSYDKYSGPVYYVDSDGRYLRPTIGKGGRLRYGLKNINGKFKKIGAAVIVLQAFVGPKPSGMESCHFNDKAYDNRLYNLRWDTHRNNIADRTRNGGTRHGSTNNNSKLTEGQVMCIKALYVYEDSNKTRLAKRFGIHPTVIYSIIRGKTWKHVGQIVI